MAKLENLCKNATEVKKIYKEQYLDRKELIGTKEFPICDALYILQKLYLMAMYGEKDATYQELEPHFLAAKVNGREIIGYTPATEYYSRLLEPFDTEEDRKRFLDLMGYTDIPTYGDYVLLSSEIKYEFEEWWNHKNMEFTSARAKVDKARSEFEDEYKISWCDLYDLYDKQEQWELSRCKDPQPEVSYKVDRSFTFDKESDIIITDPCYIYHWVGKNNDKWTVDNIPSSRDTLYGDWSCSVYECDKDKFPTEDEEAFGHFCADAGLVCVENIRNIPKRTEVLKWTNSHKWCATIIEDFVGVIEYQIRTEYYAKDAKWNPSDSLIIRGYGKKAGKDFSFIACQTGL